jgi:hypothetical protein
VLISTMCGICQYIGKVIDKHPVCIETGSTYVVEETNLVHTTTNNIVEHICIPNDGVLVSLDIDAKHQDLARSACPKSSLVLFGYGDSVSSLQAINQLGLSVDLLCLDSAEFVEEHMVREFNAIKSSLNKERHFILVDDIHNPNSVKYKKMVPLLKSFDYIFIEVPTPTGLFVAAKGYPLFVGK